MDRGHLPETWFDERAPQGMDDGGDVARWGALVRGRIAGWFDGAADSEFDRTLSIYYGPQGAHDLLERTAWHCGQHLRQLYVLAERLNIKPADTATDGRVQRPADARGALVGLASSCASRGRDSGDGAAGARGPRRALTASLVAVKSVRAGERAADDSRPDPSPCGGWARPVECEWLARRTRTD